MFGVLGGFAVNSGFDDCFVGRPLLLGLLPGLLPGLLVVCLVVGRRGPLDVVLPDWAGCVLVRWIDGSDGTLGALLAGPPRFGWLARDFTFAFAPVSEPRAISLTAPSISVSATFFWFARNAK
jgi:hypothetical protein